MKTGQLHTLKVLCIGVLGVFVAMVLIIVAADIQYLWLKRKGISDVIALLSDQQVARALSLSLKTSIMTLVLVILTSVPAGYALSRYRIPGYYILNSIVDIPIVLPPVVIGISLLAFFGFGIGADISAFLDGFNISLSSWIGIVMCQYLIAVSYCIRTIKSGFDDVGEKYEHVALTLGCTPIKAFFKVSIPLAGNGIIAGSVMSWARAIGIFGPLMAFVGTSPDVQVMPTSIWLELSTGNIEASIIMALVMILLAGMALTIVHWIAPGKDIL